MTQELYQGRLIAMLDVLGFEERLNESAGLPSIVNVYTDLIREAKIYAFGRKAVPGSPAPPSPNFELGEFVFDTLILVSRPIDTHDPAPANALDLR